MAATVINLSSAGPFGAAGTLATVTPDTANGNAFTNQGGVPTVLVVTNNSASSINVTITLPSTQYNGVGAFGTTQVTAVPASSTRYFCFEPSVFNNSSAQVTFLCSASASVTAGVIAFTRLTF